MRGTTKQDSSQRHLLAGGADLTRYVPRDLGDTSDPQTAVPRIARDSALTRRIEQAVQTIPTTHRLLTKLVRERLYDFACFLMSNAEDGLRGEYREPAPELSFDRFIASPLARAIAIDNLKNPGRGE